MPYLWAGKGKPRDPVLFHDPDRSYELRLDLGASGSALGSLLHPGGCKEDDKMLADLETLCNKGEGVKVSHLTPGDFLERFLSIL